MTMLMTDRRRSVGVRDAEHEQDLSQGSLFGPDSLAPPARPPGPTPDPFARVRPAPAAAAPPAAEDEVPSATTAPVGLLAPAPEPAEVVEPADYLEEPTGLDPAHAGTANARSVLAGPTLDDVMSRAWEGLRAEVPTPCPVCRAEIEPVTLGHCGTCGSTLD